MNISPRVIWVFIALTCVLPAVSQTASPATNSAALWTNLPWSDSKYFPIAVWTQAPTNAARFRQAGINTYVSLWKGPTDADLKILKREGMWVVCEPNEVALRQTNDSPIIAWMHQDEPDNAQSFGARFGWSSPIAPEKIVAGYKQIKAADVSRPVLLNLGQGVAWDGWYGRGTRNNHPEDYPKYLEGCDLASFDIYPATHTSRPVAGNLWYVARGVERLIQWTEGKKPVWTCIEAAHIENPKRKPTPHEIRCEVWMALIHGSRGVIYFVHQFKPKFIEAALLQDTELLPAVTELNRQITELAPVLNSATVRDAATVQSTNAAVPVATMVKRLDGATYLFAVAMRGETTKATFALKGFAGDTAIEVLDEKRSLTAKDGSFSDDFAPWAVHLYHIK